MDPEVTHVAVHCCGEFSTSITVQVEQGAVFVDPFLDYDVATTIASLLGNGSAFITFSKVVLQHDNILVPTFCPM